MRVGCLHGGGGGFINDPLMTVGVHPLAGFDKLLHYKVPETLCAQIAVGSLVRVPMLNRQLLGIVGEISEPKDFPIDRLKSVAAVVYPFPALPPDLLGLARWMTGYYAAKLDGIIEAMLPAAVRNAASLKQEKLLSVTRQLDAEELAALTKRAPAQGKLYAFLAQQFKPQQKSLVLSRLDVTAAVVTALVKRDIVREEERRVERIAYSDDWSTGEIVASQPLSMRSRPRSTRTNSASPSCTASPARAKPRSTCAPSMTRWRPAEG